MATRTLTRQSVLRLLALIRPKHKKYLLGLTLRVALTTTERVVIAFLIRMVVDAIIAVDQTAFTRGMINWVAFYVGFTLVAPFVLYLWRSALAEVTANVRETIFRHLNRLPLGYHEAHHSGDALSILTNDLTAAEKAYQDDLFMLAEATAHGLGAVVAMLLLRPAAPPSTPTQMPPTTGSTWPMYPTASALATTTWAVCSTPILGPATRCCRTSLSRPRKAGLRSWHSRPYRVHFSN